MEQKRTSEGRHVSILLAVLVFLGLYTASRYGFLLFHTLGELFSIAVAGSIFMIVWNSRRFFDNSYLLFIGVAYLFVGCLDLVHMLAYKGMGVFPSDADIPTQLWIAARYLQSLSLLVAPLFLKRKVSIRQVVLVYSAVVTVVLLSIFRWQVFPSCFIEGEGLTPFKKVSEYIISLILLGAIFLLARNRRYFDRAVYGWIIGSIILTIVSELAFTFYVDVYGFSNLIGHFLKIIAFYFIYKAIVEIGLSRPYDLLFRNLKVAERESRKAHDELGVRVQERTAELQNTAALLKLFVTKSSRREYLDAVVGLIKRWTDCDAIGVRVLDEMGYVPYASYTGFSKEFWEQENMICVRDHACICTRVILDENEKTSINHRTPSGSFCCNDIPAFVAGLSEEEKELYRGRCFEAGYRSLAIIPIRYRGKPIGAIHIADRKEGRIPDSMVEYMESVNPLIGEAIQRFALEEKLHESEEKYRSIFENALEGIFQATEEGGYLSVNPALTRMLGFESQEMVTAHAGCVEREMYAKAEDRESLLALLKERGSVEGFIAQVLRRDGRKIWVSVNARAVRDKQGALTYYEGTVEDITRRREAEEERQRLAAVVENTGEAIFILDPGFIVRYANPAFTALTGYSPHEIIGRDIKLLRSDDRPDAFWEKIRATVSAGQPWSDIRLIRRKDGTVAAVRSNVSSIRDSSGQIVHFVVVCHDISEQQKLEAQLRQAQKMEALGTLTGGIAHDFNNILAAIMGFSELAASRLTKGSREEHFLRRVLEAAVRARELIKQMLIFSRKTEQEKKPLQLSSAIKETIKLLRASIPSTIGVRVNIQSESGLILADPVQIQQTLMNLCTNAAYAMREKGGILDIDLGDYTVPASSGESNGMKAGLYMKLSVRDSGVGIAPEIMDKIYDPFFTTKKMDEGTGLGLSVVHGIVKQHGGHIVAVSAPGSGSTFSVYFPRVAENRPREIAPRQPVPGGWERVLLVDDEEALVEMARELLEEIGYQVTSKTGSVEALELFRSDPNSFDLVITDQTMPEMTGLELTRELMAIRPGIPVILSTGFSHAVEAADAKKAGIRAFMMKPLTKGELARTVRKVLDNDNDVLSGKSGAESEG
jgi:PAS domain S-box-containing protein